jgi:Zn-dependent protease with chaperone function
MPIAVSCPGCQGKFTAPDHAAGKSVKCPKCSGRITIAAPSVVPAIPMAELAPEPQPVVVNNPLSTASQSPMLAKPATAAVTATAVGRAAPVAPLAQTIQQSSATQSKPERKLSPAEIQSQIMRKFTAEAIPPIEATTNYNLAAFAVGLVMVVLLVIYLGMILFIGNLVIDHFANNWTMMNSTRGKGSFIALVFYLGIGIVGLITLLFMIKPFFAKAHKESPEAPLTKEQEPILHAFIERVCRAVHAPMPRYIKVNMEPNAYASTGQGLFSFTNSELTLCIGLPLVSGLTLQQFAGVLAHEFGHFSQSTGMRVSKLIRTISFWFARVVYERDIWDYRLESWAKDNDIRIGFIFYIAMGLIWVVRKVLWCLMMTGNLASGFLMRQMEYDADRHETRFSGSASFAKSQKRIGLLIISERGAEQDLYQFHRDGRWPDDWARLILVNLEQLKPEVLAKIEKYQNTNKTGFFDTHPSDTDRINSAMAEQAPGIFHDDGPATILFSDFDRLAKIKTKEFYESRIEKTIAPEKFISVDNMLEMQKAERTCYEALGRYFQGRFSSLRPLPWTEMNQLPVRTASEALEKLKEIRQQLFQALPNYYVKYTEYRQTDSHWLELDQIIILLAVDERPRTGEFKLLVNNYTHAMQIQDNVHQQLAAQTKALRETEKLAIQRIWLALKLAEIPQVAERINDIERIRKGTKVTLLAVQKLHELWRDLLQFRQNYHMLGALITRIMNGSQNDKARRQALERLGEIHRNIQKFLNELVTIEYPFDHADGQKNLAQMVLGWMPEEGNIQQIYQAADELFDNMPEVTIRCLARLCYFVEQIETGLGLDPFPEPPPRESYDMEYARELAEQEKATPDR